MKEQILELHLEWLILSIAVGNVLLFGIWS